MSDYISQVESQIYHTRWQPQMSLSQIAEDSDYISELADKNFDDRYALIVDMTDSSNYALDVSGLTKVAKSDPRITAYVFIHADMTAKFIGNMLEKLTKQDFIFTNSYDEALAHARESLKVSVK